MVDFEGRIQVQTEVQAELGRVRRTGGCAGPARANHRRFMPVCRAQGAPRHAFARAVLRIGFSNAPFSSPRHPEYGRTGEQGRDAAPDVLESAGRDLLASCWVLMAQPKFASPGCRLRVDPCLRAASIGPENPRTQPTPAALVAGSPELSRLGSLRPLAGPGHGPAPGAAHAPATPGA